MSEESLTSHSERIGWGQFLKDVFICSLGAYGGPEAHYGVFLDQLVVKKKYLTEEEMVELMALTGILPGPSSTQTIVAIGYKIGGPLLALWTMLVWALPVLCIMTGLSFYSYALKVDHQIASFLTYIGPMAVGFMIVAAYRITSKVVKDRLTLGLLVLGAIVTYFYRVPWIFPAVLILGGLAAILTSQEKDLWNRIELRPPWKYLIAFAGFAILSLILSLTTDIKVLKLFEMFYRYGYLVIGGGNVVIPLMNSELVDLHHYMTHQDFLTGYGIVQGMPGPMFSFAAYAGGMAASGGHWLTQLLGAMAGGLGIFLPGLLLIYFVYPIWEDLKQIKGIKVSLRGITAVAGGLVLTSALILLQKSGLSWDNVLVMALTVVLLLWKKIPAPLIVVMMMILGIVFH